MPDKWPDNGGPPCCGGGALAVIIYPLARLRLAAWRRGRP